MDCERLRNEKPRAWHSKSGVTGHYLKRFIAVLVFMTSAITIAALQTAKADLGAPLLKNGGFEFIQDANYSPNEVAGWKLDNPAQIPAD